MLLLFALRFLERSKFLGMANRPLATAAGLAAIVGIVYLTLTGFGGARPYGNIILVPDRALTPTETLGLQASA